MVQTRTDQSINLPKVRIDQAFGEQAGVKVRGRKRGTITRGCGLADGVRRCARRRIEVEVVGARRDQMYAMRPHRADGERGVGEELALDFEIRFQDVGSLEA